jgi:hypothetical protein
MKHAWPILGAALLLMGEAGARGVDWRPHLAARAQGPDKGLAPVDPQEHVHRKVSRDIEYVSLRLEALFLRDLPGFLEDDAVVLGVEVQGVLRDDRVLKTVSDVRRCSSRHCLLTFDHLMLIQPFVYSGREVSFNIHVRALTSAEARHARGRISGLTNLLGKLDPHDREALQAAAGLFEGIVGAATSARASWKYRFTLFPADTLIEGEPESLFTAARHILLLLPPPDAPEELRHLRLRALLPRLKLLGSRLVWKADDREYTESPYLILDVQRYRRYPHPDTAVKKLRRRIERAFADGNLDHAEELVRALQPVVTQEEAITAAERNLERAWIDDWTARIETARAALRKDLQAEFRAAVKEAIGLLRIERRFQEVLEQAELKDTGHRLTRIQDRVQELTRELKVPFPLELQEALANLRSQPVPPAKLAPGPLAVQVWTDKKEYRQGEQMRVFVRGNAPFFARLVYRDASGRLLQLLPNRDRTQSYFLANKIYEIPAAEDTFTMEVSPPFGSEAMILYASSTPLGEVPVEAAEEGVFVIKGSLEEVAARTRGIRLKTKSDGFMKGVALRPQDVLVRPRRDFVTAQAAVRTLPR